MKFKDTVKEILVEQQSLNLKGKTIAPGISAKHSSDYVNKDEENLFITGLNKIISSHKFALPIHVRAFAHFLIGRTTPFTENDMTSEEKDFLKKAALNVGERGFTYRFWDDIAGTLGAGSNSERDSLGLANMSDPIKFYHFLGRVPISNIKIKPNKTNVTIIDNYDMNVHDKRISEEDVMKQLEKAIIAFKKSPLTNLYPVIRRLAAVRELGGYNGYPVNINL